MSEKDYQAEQDHHTLTRAEDIKEDAGRMKAVHRHHKKQMASMKKVGRTFGAVRKP
jgi:hypothetical protein